MLSSAASSAALIADAGSGRLHEARAFALGRTQRMTGAQMDAVSKDFESMFVAQMLGSMFGESVGDDLFGDKETKEIYKALMVEEYGKQIADSGGIGIASYIKRELLALQEVDHG